MTLNKALVIIVLRSNNTARVEKLVDSEDLKSSACKGVPVRVRSRAPNMFFKKVKMKTTATFKLTKRNKTILALGKFTDQDQRHAFKHMMIEAQVAASTVIKSKKDRESFKETNELPSIV